MKAPKDVAGQDTAKMKAQAQANTERKMASSPSLKQANAIVSKNPAIAKPKAK